MTDQEIRYRAVDVVELRRLLGSQCSPDPYREGYVVGPVTDEFGRTRLAHVASCFSMVDAKRLAERYNREDENDD